MKNISIAAVIDKNKLASDQAWLIALRVEAKHPLTGEIDSVLRIVRNDEPVTIDGEIYEPMPFDIKMEESADSLPVIQITIQDQTQIVQSYLQGYAGGVGFPVTVMAVTGDNKDALSSEAELQEYFEVINGSADSGSYVVNWELGVENPLSIRFPKRKMYQDLCTWRYKSAYCKYNGPLPSCDLTLNGSNGCRVHDNVTNFSSAPGLISRG